jgi:AMIN domain
LKSIIAKEVNMLKRSRSNSKRFFGLLLWRRLNAKDWYQRLLSASILGLCGVLTMPSITIAVAPNAQLQDWRFSPEFGQLEFTLSGASVPKVFFLSQPSRLVVDLPGTKLGFVPTQQNYSGAIQRVRLSQLDANVTRIVLDFAPGTPINPSQVLVQPTSPTSWVLRPFANFSSNTVPSLNAPLPPGNNIPQTGIYAPLPPTTNTAPYLSTPLPPGNNNPQAGIYAPLPPNNAAPVLNAPQSSKLVAPPGINFPITNTGTQQQPQPFVTVPPLNTNNSSPIPGSVLPPATFPNQSGGIVSNPPLISPNFNGSNVVPTVPSNPISNTDPNGVVPWGQSLPPQR